MSVRFVSSFMCLLKHEVTTRYSYTYTLFFSHKSPAVKTEKYIAARNFYSMIFGVLPGLQERRDNGVDEREKSQPNVLIKSIRNGMIDTVVK